MLPTHSLDEAVSCNFFFKPCKKAFARESRSLNYLNISILQFSIFN